MKEYMLIFRNEIKNGAPPSEEQMKMLLQQWQTWITDIARKGRYGGTNRLMPVGSTIKPDNVVTDGPYLEAKEMMGGYLIVKAGSLDEAINMAQSCPNLKYGGNVEVREVMKIDYDPQSKTFLHQTN